MPAKKKKCDRYKRPVLPTILIETYPVKRVCSTSCQQSLTTSCSMCSMMDVKKHKHNGSACTTSKCGLGFWTGGNSWNRLYPADA